MWPVMLMYGLLIPLVVCFIIAKQAQASKDKKDETLPVTLKALCTVTILLTAIAAPMFGEEIPTVYTFLIAAGLVLGLAGDLGICASFISGMILFGLGHIAYITAFWHIDAHILWAIPLLVVFFALLLVVLHKITRTKKRSASLDRRVTEAPLQLRMSRPLSMDAAPPQKSFAAYRVPVMVYGFIILSMLSIALTLPFPFSLDRLLLAVGAVLFVISDATLAWNAFGHYTKRLDAFSLICYFTAQSLFATSLYIIVS